MNEMVERVARAIAEIYASPLYSYGDPPPPEVIARVAIAAMHEPVEAIGEMAERVARAMYAASEEYDGEEYPGWDAEPEFIRAAAVRNARAAIAAMRKPTEAMLKAAVIGDNELGLDRHLHLIWQDMIDAALKEP